MSGGSSIRIRGMYATALTSCCLDHDFEVVDPSSTIADRIAHPFQNELPTVSIRDTSDRVGAEVTGREGVVTDVADVIQGVSVDTLTIRSRLPQGAIFGARVEDTNGSGAIVATGEGQAFLPFGMVEGYVETGDRLDVQVVDPEPPWSTTRRPVVGTEFRVPGTYLSLHRGVEADIVSSPEESLALSVQRLDADLPDEWGVAIHGTAEAVDTSLLREELSRLTTSALALEEEVAAAQQDVGRVATPLATTWCRFGRGGRFALDEVRERAATTLEGHHRIKMMGETPATAVDFLEAYELSDLSYDPDIVLETFGPTIGDRIRIEHGKPDDTTIDLGRGDVTAREENGSITVVRELTGKGSYDELDVPKEAGDRAETTFVEGQWWYPTVYRSAKGTYRGTYVNVGTPVEILPDRVRYVDLFVDVVKSPNGDVRVVDRGELHDAMADGTVPTPLGDHAESVAEAIVDAF